MWNFSTDYNKWFANDDKLTRQDFELLKQELQSVRFWSKCLSGATYIPVNSLTNIYDVLQKYKPRNWYISNVGSPYSVSAIPPQNAEPISSTSSFDYYSKYLSEYGLTLKNLFTPTRLIKDSLDNFISVDVATTEPIDLTQVTDNYIIDGIRLLPGQRILVKDQITTTALLNSVNPDTFFVSNYTTVRVLGATIEYSFYNQENGIYIYQDGQLVRDRIFDDYRNCIRASVDVKLGQFNVGKQFHLSRLLNGYFPTTFLNEPFEFQEKKNWILRNRVDYNNLFETNYYDIIKNGTQSYYSNGITYSIPPRTISVGEFGVILNYQENKSNIIFNKFKVNLKSISQTSNFYWICGDENTLLKVRKHDFDITRVPLEQVPSKFPQTIKTNLTSVSFFDDLRGVVVGELNTIFVTKNGGFNWERIELPDFASYNYTKVLFDTSTSFYLSGKNGIFIEMVDTLAGWVAYKRRISKRIDEDDEYLLVDNINDLYKTTINTWSASYSYSTASVPVQKELIFIVTDNSNILAYDKNGIFTEIPSEFIYFDFSKHYGDIRNITQKDSTDTFYFTGNEPSTNQDGIFSFDINNFPLVGTGTSYSNTAVGLTFANFEKEVYPNEIFDYNGQELFICGNNALLSYSTYSVLDFNNLDDTFFEKIKSKFLFLDYDIASKVNFFTDNGDYRLPNSLTFSGSTQSLPNLSFEPLIIGATGPSYLTQSETNWITYYTDRQKTFEFYTSTPMDDSVKVLISTTFSYSPISASYSISTITSSASQISLLAPNIISPTYSSRYDSTGLPAISPPTVNFDLYLYDYLLVANVSTSFPVDVGDVMRFQSSVVDTDLVVNKVLTFGGNKFLYMYSEFNSNIIKDLLTTTYSVSMFNLNKFDNITELHYRFNEHPIGQAYKLEYSDVYGNVTQPEDDTSGILKVSALFNNLTSYYNLATKIISGLTEYEMKYTTSFLNFGYSPTYNILTYLESINTIDDVNPTFYATKEYLAMPEYRGIPLGSLGTGSTNAYIDYNGMTYSGGSFSMTGNKILFGTDLFFEWQSIFKDTYVDISINGSLTYSSTYGFNNDRMLVTDKYYDPILDAYAIEFHRRLEFTLNDPVILNGGSVDIISRRKLIQISEDLQELNNIQRARNKSVTVDSTVTRQSNVFYNYERELNYKISTDSYAKILMSDSETISKLSAIVYIDYKNELSMNITRLAQQVSVPISNTSITGMGSAVYDPGKLYVTCFEKHGLSTGDGAVLEFNGGTGSSELLNNQYFGYHPIIKITDYDFVVDIDYGSPTLIGNDTGTVNYIKQDPFFNYLPIDLIDIGVDQRGKQSVELRPENLILSGSTFSLLDIDFEKYRFRLIDGLTLESLNNSFGWVLEAEISDAIIGYKNNQIVWHKGTWECGRWFNGIWNSGVWMSGDWYGGTWNSYKIKDDILTVNVDAKTVDYQQSIWFSGRWFDGLWTGGTWNNGRWYGGTWQNGIWYNGTWNDGIWKNGQFTGGIWILGQWENGILNCNNGPTYWLDGKWSGGDFENGMWYDGIWEQKNSLSRFGTNAFNSRTATWQGGQWLSGSFYSKLNLNDDADLDVSESHKFSIWKTGLWISGDWYGGIAYNMDWKLGTWYGGILDEIQIIGIDTSDDSFVLNGVFKFNIGDEILVIDNQLGGSYSVFGSNDSPTKYKIVYAEDFTSTKITKVFVDRDLSLLGNGVSHPIETGLRIVSKFRNLNWKSGIWTNGFFESGLWEGGIWYNGIFEATWM